MGTELPYSSRCEGFGQTIWEHCFWVNNVGVIAGAIVFLVWVPPIVWFVRRDERTFPKPVLPGQPARRRVLPTGWGVVTALSYAWLLFGWIPGMLLGFRVVWPLWLRMLGYQ